mmetsp:Transcript_14062/g.32417  ORF Transcript_14062/g.32417 Transcript_14062/m.32417 type:complete len:217 (+) Transcript_14062:92-742(+)
MSLSIAADRIFASLSSGLGRTRTSSLLQILLVVLLSRVENLGSLELGVEGAAKLGLHFLDRLLSLSLLFRSVKVDAMAVLGAAIVTDLILQRRVDPAEENLAELLERDFLGVVGELDDLGVSRSSSADHLVGRMLQLSLCVAHGRCHHPRHSLVRQLDAPEASSSEGGNGMAGLGDRLHLPLLGILRCFSRPCSGLEIAVLTLSTASEERSEKTHS